MSNTMEGFKELTFFIFVVVFFGVYVETCDNDLTSKSAAVRLSNDLLCDYNKNVRPVMNQSTPINVDMTMYLRNIFMDDEWELMTVSFFLKMSWKDEFLIWDPSKYENIKNVYEYSDLIWIPDVVSLNPGFRGSDDFSYSLPTSKVQILHDGTIYYKHLVTQHVQCSINIAEWPFDSHNCSFFIGSPLYLQNYVNYSLPEENIINLISHNSNREWALNSVQKKCENLLPPRYNISRCIHQLILNVERLSSMYHSTVVIPTVVISLMRTFTFLMGRETSLRIMLLCLFFITELLYIQFLDFKVPNNGEHSVYIVLFCRNSILLTAVALIMSVISNELYKRSTEDFPSDGPEWAKNLIKLLLNKKAINLLTSFNTQEAELLVEKNEEEDTVNSQRDEKALFWKTLYILLDRLFFLITLIFSFINFFIWIL